MSKTIWAVLAVVVIGGGLAVVLNRPDEQPRQTAQPPAATTQPPANAEPETPPETDVETVTVKYSENGFEPKELTIKAGTKVNFVNNTEVPMYVASDPHPQHTDYPEFEMGVVLQRHPQPGEDFSFVFDKPGAWAFHNHAIPNHTGTVNVE